MILQSGRMHHPNDTTSLGQRSRKTQPPNYTPGFKLRWNSLCSFLNVDVKSKQKVRAKKQQADVGLVPVIHLRGPQY